MELFTRRLYLMDDKKFKGYELSTKVGLINQSKRLFQKTLNSRGDMTAELQRIFNPLKTPETVLVKMTGEGSNSGTYQYFERPKDMYIDIEVSVDVRKDIGKHVCRKTFISESLITGDAFAAQNSGYFVGSFDFEQSYRDEDLKGIRLFHSGDFDFEQARIIYYKEVEDFHVASLSEDGSYDYFGERITKDVSLPFGVGYEEILLDVASVLARDDVQDLSLEIQKIFNIKKIIQ